MLLIRRSALRIPSIDELALLRRSAMRIPSIDELALLLQGTPISKASWLSKKQQKCYETWSPACPPMEECYGKIGRLSCSKAVSGETPITGLKQATVLHALMQLIASMIQYMMASFKSELKKASHVTFQKWEKIAKIKPSTNKRNVLLGWCTWATPQLWMDFSKVYDCLLRDSLIAKLEAYGIEMKSLKLIYSYLNSLPTYLSRPYYIWRTISDLFLLLKFKRMVSSILSVIVCKVAWIWLKTNRK